MTESPASASSSEARAASVVSHALRVLRCFSAAEPTLGVTEIAARVGLHKSTVSRLLTTLEREDVVERIRESLAQPYDNTRGGFGITARHIFAGDLEARTADHRQYGLDALAVVGDAVGGLQVRLPVTDQQVRFEGGPRADHLCKGSRGRKESIRDGRTGRRCPTSPRSAPSSNRLRSSGAS